MSKVLFSLKQEYYEKIISGEKKFEFRRRIFKRDVDSIVIYVTSPVKMVMAEFTVKNIHQGAPGELWDISYPYTGIEKPLFDKYFLGTANGYAIEIGRVIVYEQPFSIKNIPSVRKAPQSFVYI
ncbi:50S ribosomal protein L22 [compost metagenome]